MRIDYILANPTENITALVKTVPTAENRQEIIRAVFEREPSCEQVGFISCESDHRIKLEMMGYEFCGNACLSAACYLAIINNLLVGERDIYVVLCSGAEDPVIVEVIKTFSDVDNTGKEYYEFSATINIEKPILDEIANLPVVHLNGISHMLAPDGSIDPEIAEENISTFAAKYDAPAFGIINYKMISDNEVEITPLVYVKESDTVVWEHGCASGSTAIGYYLSEKKRLDSVLVKQPGGIIQIDASEDDLALTGNVKFEF